MKILHNSSSVENNIRIAGKLRNLCLSLPRILQPWEKELWSRFEVLSTEAKPSLDTKKLLRCFEIAWRWKRFDLIVKAGDCYPKVQIDADRELSTYYYGAKRILAWEEENS